MGSIKISIITSLYRCEDFLQCFLGYVSRISNPAECELIVVHNDASVKELEILGNFRPGLLQVIHIKVEREGLYSSWNRAVKFARGKYMAVWNVDDIRTADSLQLQLQALENSNAVMCYSDFYGAAKYGEHKEVFYTYKKDFEKFRKQSLKRHIVGCFPMWKKEIHNQIGYFDEQFRLVADFDFQIRVILNFDLVKCEGITGYHLIDLPHKLSSNRFLQQKEQTVLKLRYQLYNQILLHILPFIKSYRVYQYCNFGKWYSLQDVVPEKLLHSRKLWWLVSMPVVYSGWVIKKVSVKTFKLLVRLVVPGKTPYKSLAVKTG